MNVGRAINAITVQPITAAAAEMMGIDEPFDTA
jgi:hypothetical protein